MPPKQPRRPVNLRQRSVLAGEAAAASAEVERALTVPADTGAAAFFDVDNTLMQGASIFHLARGLHRREFFTTAETDIVVDAATIDDDESWKDFV